MNDDIKSISYDDYIKQIFYDYIKVYDICSLKCLLKYISDYKFIFLSKSIIYLDLNIDDKWTENDIQKLINSLFYLLQCTFSVYFHVITNDVKFLKKLNDQKIKIKQKERINVINKIDIKNIKFNKICLIKNNRITIKYNSFLLDVIA